MSSIVGARNAHAQRRRGELPYIERTLSVEARHVEIDMGFGFADHTWDGRAGAGMNLDVAVGIVRGLEIGGGVGGRFGWNAQHVGAEQWARVNREWLPGDGYAPNRVLGTDTFTNPYLHVQYAFLQSGPIQVGVQASTNFPVARAQEGFIDMATCWSPGFAVPVHIVIRETVRIETGWFHQFMAGGGCNGYVDTYLYVPLRVNLAITRSFWLGVRSGFEANNYRIDRDNYAIPLGFQGGFRLVRGLDLMWDLVFPKFVHYSYDLGRNTFFDVWGAGVGFRVYVP